MQFGRAANEFFDVIAGLTAKGESFTGCITTGIAMKPAIARPAYLA